LIDNFFKPGFKRLSIEVLNTEVLTSDVLQIRTINIRGVARNLVRGTKQGVWGRKSPSRVQGQSWKLETY